MRFLGIYKQYIDQNNNLSYIYEENSQSNRNFSSTGDFLMSSCLDSVNWDKMVKKYAKKRLIT
jgi:hypothetical protein